MLGRGGDVALVVDEKRGEVLGRGGDVARRLLGRVLDLSLWGIGVVEHVKIDIHDNETGTRVSGGGVVEDLVVISSNAFNTGIFFGFDI